MKGAALDAKATNGIRQPLSARSFLFVLLVLVMCLVAVDVTALGPMTVYAAQVLVVAPVESTWGFHAERKKHDWYPYELLTIVRVTPGGAFDRAGIKPGFAIAPRQCTFGGPWFGGLHSPFLGEQRAVRCRFLLPEPGGRWREEIYDITRQHPANPRIQPEGG